MEKSIIRHHYLDQIKPFVGKQIIKVLTGARRVGKTTILQQLTDYITQEDDSSNIIYINKEYHEFKDLTNAENLFDYVIGKSNSKKMNYIFIDEIQEIENFEIALRHLFAKNFDVYCTGSNAQMLSGDLATHLSGRYVDFQINSLSYAEFLQFHTLVNNNTSFNKFIKYGGLPYLIHLEHTDEIVYGYLKSIYNTIILKDVVARYRIRDVDFLERLIEYLSDNLGSYVSSKKISDFVKSQRIGLSVNTVLNYLNYLVNSFFIQKAQRYDIVGKKRFEINEKYFFGDLGLKHAVVPFNTNDIGKVLENLVYNKLISNNFKVYIGKHHDREIDFVASKGDQQVYIQVAYLISDQNVHEREFGNLLKIADNHSKIVVSMDDLAESNYKGIHHTHIRNFLLQDSKLF